MLSVSAQLRIANISNRLAKLIAVCIISDMTESNIFWGLLFIILVNPTKVLNGKLIQSGCKINHSHLLAK